MTLLVNSIFLFSISTPTSRDTLDLSSNPLTLPKIADESENIDTFDVHPSTRWNLTDLSSRVSDTIDTSNYEIISNNLVETDTNFEMNRKLNTLDSEITMRSNMSYSDRNHEYFQDYKLDPCDFEEDDEDMDGGGISGESVVDGVYQNDMASPFSEFVYFTDLTLDFDLELSYTYILRVKANETCNIGIYFSNSTAGFYAGKSVSLTTSWSTQEFLFSSFTFNKEFNNVKRVYGYLATGSSVMVYIDFIKIEYDITFSQDLEYFRNIELDVCDFWEDKDSFNDADRNAYGYIEEDAVLGASNANITSGTIAVDTSEYSNVSVRVKSSDTETNYFVVYGNLGGSYKQLTVNSANPISSSWTSLNIDLSLDADWTGTCVNLRFYFYDNDFTQFEGNETFFLDWVTLPTETNSNTKICDWGFYDHALNYYPLQISETITNDVETFKISIVNQDATIASYYSSSYSLVNEYIFYEFKYDLERSDFQIRFYYDNETRIDTINYPDDFTITDTTPDLFSVNAISLYYRINTYNNTYVVNTIDYIEAEFKEREWVEYTNPADIGTNTWDVCYLNTTTHPSADTIGWRLSVPKLDAVSFDMINLLTGNLTGFGSSDTYMESRFAISTIDSTDGSVDDIITIYLSQVVLSGTYYRRCTVEEGVKGIIYSVTEYNVFHNISMSTSFASSEDRTKLTLKMAYDNNYDSAENNKTYITDEVYLNEVSDNPSDEYLIQFYRRFEKDTDHELLVIVDNFALVEADVFADIGGFIGGIVTPVISGGGDIFSGLASLFAAIFTPLITWLGGFLAAVFGLVGESISSVLSLALDSLGSLLTGALSSLGSLLDGTLQIIDGVLDSILTAITELAEDIIDALIEALEDVINGLILIADVLYDLVDTIISEAVSALGLGSTVSSIISLTDEILGFLGDAIDLIIDTLAFLIDVIDLTLVLITPLILAYVFIGSATQASDAFDWIGRCIEKLNADLLPNIQILGFTGNIKVYFIVIPGILLYV